MSSINPAKYRPMTPAEKVRDAVVAAPAILIMSHVYFNWKDAPVNVFDWTVVLPAGIPIAVAFVVGWGTGMYCGWTARGRKVTTDQPST